MTTMPENIYKRLAEHLDNLPAGFPPTETGVELRILKRLFTPAEAEFALHMTLIPEEPHVVARRAKISTHEAAERLEAMALKGLLFRMEETPGKPAYMAAQYVVGIWEFNVDNLDPELIRDMEEYMPTLFGTAWKKPQLRTIPVGQSVTNDLEVMSYERAEELVRRHDKFAVNPCICRRERKMVGEGCNKPEASCLAFGMAADYSIKNGYGREIDKTETLALLKSADEAGLVLQPGNSKQPGFICCCCGCCCGVLRTLKKYPRPVEYFSAPFIANVDPESCSACGQCEDRCQMEALQLTDDAVSLDKDRCIGCGLCVTTCPTGALTLKRRTADEQITVPRNTVTATIGHGWTRDKLKTGDLIKLLVKSKVDRVLASRK